MCYPMTNLFMNYGCYDNYQFGTGIAGLFTGLSPYDSVWMNGCSGLGYGYGTGCGCGYTTESNGFNWGMLVGGVLSIATPIACAWIGNARAGKISEQRQAEIDKNNINKDITTLGLNKTITELMAVNDLDVQLNTAKADIINTLTDPNEIVLKVGDGTSSKDAAGWQNEVTTLTAQIKACTVTSKPAEYDPSAQASNSDGATSSAKYNYYIDIKSKLDNAKTQLGIAKERKKDYDNAVAARAKKEKELNAAIQRIKNYVNSQKEIRKAAEQKAQAKSDNRILNAGNGNIFTRASDSDKKFKYNSETGKIEFSKYNNTNYAIKDFEKADWYALVDDYMNGNNAEKKAIANFVKTNWSYIGKLNSDQVNTSIEKALKLIKSKASS